MSTACPALGGWPGATSGYGRPAPPVAGSLAEGLAALRAALRATAGAVPAGWLARAVPADADRPTATAAGTAVGTGTVPAPARGGPPGPPEGDQAEVMGMVEAAQQGDPEAFGRLYDRYVDLVYRYIYYRVGGRALAEDLTSETFLRALRRIGSFTWQGRDFGAWLITIARNLVADHFKSGRYRLEVATADMVGEGADRPEQGPEEQVLDAITNAQLLAAVKRLNPEQQECICLRFLQGLSVAETALAMGKNEGAIKALQYRAVRSLGRMLPAEAIT